MLERDSESAAEATDPTPTGKEPVTKGGGESGHASGKEGHSPGTGAKRITF